MYHSCAQTPFNCRNANSYCLRSLSHAFFSRSHWSACWRYAGTSPKQLKVFAFSKHSCELDDFDSCSQCRIASFIPRTKLRCGMRNMPASPPSEHPTVCVMPQRTSGLCQAFSQWYDRRRSCCLGPVLVCVPTRLCLPPSFPRILCNPRRDILDMRYEVSIA